MASPTAGDAPDPASDLPTLPPDLLGTIRDLLSDDPCVRRDVRQWAALSRVCKDWRDGFRGVPLQLRFQADLTSAQKRWLVCTDARVQRIVFEGHRPREQCVA